MAEPIRVLLGDDHPLVRAGIRAMIAATADIEIVGEAQDAWEVQRLCRELAADVLVMDLKMPGPPAQATMAYAHEQCPDLKVLIITAYEGDEDVRPLVEAGVSGYVQKSESLDVVMEAIRVLAHGGTWFKQGTVRSLTMAGTQIASTGPALTDGELAVLRLVVQGKRDREVSELLGIGERTVRDRLNSASAKLGADTRVHVAVEAVRRGLV
jgi:DNA-binding NarL/FixJ family response regulator